LTFIKELLIFISYNQKGLHMNDLAALLIIVWLSVGAYYVHKLFVSVINDLQDMNI